jgi:flagellar export protein FliJ
MSRERIARVVRVLEARQGMAERIMVELSTLTRAASNAEHAARQAKADWFDAMNVTLASICSSSDLAEQHAYATTLGHRYSACENDARAVLKHRDACNARLQAARIEVRKLELWIDRVRESAALEETARDARAMDELAARMTRTA